jgi:hypothetical protein
MAARDILQRNYAEIAKNLRIPPFNDWRVEPAPPAPPPPANETLTPGIALRDVAKPPPVHRARVRGWSRAY